MDIDELKDLIDLDWDAPKPYDEDRRYSQDECDFLVASGVLWECRKEIVALIEAANLSYGYSEPWATMKALGALNLKLESL